MSKKAHLVGIKYEIMYVIYRVSVRGQGVPPLSPPLLRGRTGDQSITIKSVFTVGLTSKRSPGTW